MNFSRLAMRLRVIMVIHDEDEKSQLELALKIDSSSSYAENGISMGLLLIGITQELLPLLDFLANKVKAIRRLREVLTTNLPPLTFPVEVAIPVVPTIRVLVTFTKFEELQPLDEFSTPPLSPRLQAIKAQQ
ncbi:hypothetical protein IFM89_006012 [Coptis chinensis]|uniref:Ankyrin repeat domain-containing protein n=1 Tax=Coptis chinensis TaxID=261450 RepID=A0A835HXQ5_9MAGN|nr:hypothetical protein IFM89_006012 [Coptis chinensis]